MRDKESKKLAKSIHERDSFYIQALLDQGVKLASRDLYGAFGFGEYPEYESEIVDWLASKNALPDGVTPASLKAFIWYNGNDQNPPRDFLNQPDFNPDGCPGLATPMQLSTQKGRVEYVRELIALGAKSRPLTSVVFGAWDHSLLDRGDFEIYKTELSENLSKNNIRKQCEIADLFFLNPTQDLVHKIDQIRENQFLMFFCWAAKNNRADLLKTDFARLFVKFPKEASLALRVAVLFGSKAFVEAIIMGVDNLQHNTTIATKNFWGVSPTRFRLKKLDADEISRAMYFARSANQEMFIHIVKFLHKQGITLKEISQNVSALKFDPLVWAVGFRDEILVAFLIENGAVALNERALFEVLGRCTKKIFAMLIRPETDLRVHADSESTFLHEAMRYKKWDIAEMLIQDHNADIYARDHKRKTPLDYIKDSEIQARFIRLWQQQNNTGPTPLHLLIQSGKWFDAQFMLEYDPNVDLYALDHKNKTPLDYIGNPALKEDFLELWEKRKNREREVSSPTLNGLFENNPRQLKKLKISDDPGSDYEFKK